MIGDVTSPDLVIILRVGGGDRSHRFGPFGVVDEGIAMGTRRGDGQLCDVGAEGGPASAEDAVAGEIRRRRVAAGLSQNGVAKRAEFARQYISRAENPTYGLPSENLSHSDTVTSSLAARSTVLRGAVVQVVGAPRVERLGGFERTGR